jgi:hypothetical protein
MLAIVHTAFTWSSIVVGLASAALWYRAATVKVKKSDPRAAHDALRTSASLQSQYHRYAASATAGSVGLDAFAREVVLTNNLAKGRENWFSVGALANPSMSGFGTDAKCRLY